MGAGRSRIPKPGSNFKPPVLVATNNICNQNLACKRPDELQQLQQQQQQRNTFEIKIPCPGYYNKLNLFKRLTYR